MTGPSCSKGETPNSDRSIGDMSVEHSSRPQWESFEQASEYTRDRSIALSGAGGLVGRDGAKG